MYVRGEYVLNNGQKLPAPGIPLSFRSVKQGYPLSPLLFSFLSMVCMMSLEVALWVLLRALRA